MELFEQLPSPLRSAFSFEVPPAVVLQMHFLWQALHETCTTSLSLSHSYSRKFLALVDAHGVELTTSQRSRLCSRCGVIQLPSITTSTRLRRVALRSRVNRKRSRAAAKSAPPQALSLDRAAAAAAQHKSKAIPGTAKLVSVATTRCLQCKHTYEDSGVLAGIPRDLKNSATPVAASTSISPPQSAKKVNKQPFSFSAATSAASSAGAGVGAGAGRSADGSACSMSLLEMEMAKKKQKKLAAKQSGLGGGLGRNPPATTSAQLQQSSLRGLGSFLSGGGF